MLYRMEHPPLTAGASDFISYDSIRRYGDDDVGQRRRWSSIRFVANSSHACTNSCVEPVCGVGEDTRSEARRQGRDLAK